MNTPQIFNNELFGSLPLLIIEDIELFGATEAAKALSFSNPYDALKNHVDQDDLAVHEVIDNLGRKQNKKFINESGLYSLIIGASKQGNNKSIKENAKKFKRWVTSEVLPAIRKHGGYLTSEKVEEALLNPDTLIQLATQLKTEREGRLIAEQKVAEYEPKITYLDSILSSTDSVTTSQIAADYGMSARKLNSLLHEKRIQRKVGDQWLLYKKHMNQGYTKSHTTEIYKADGTPKIVMDTKWTQKGRLFIYELMKSEGYLPELDLLEGV